MDKEAQKKIADIIVCTHSMFDERYEPASAEEFHDEANQILTSLKELGYRKLPKDKPPLLSDEKLPHWIKYPDGGKGDVIEAYKAVAQAQREADIKFYS